ncbi:MAG: sulfatase-like hydrolase/transferase [Akkermansiaceae bacterium]
MKLFLKTFAIFFSGCLLHAGEKRRPNILFILTDDQSPADFKFYNPQSTLDSPQIDGLAAQGMVFDAAYHMGSFSGAVCTPSRHMIMSGRTVWHLPIGPGAKKCPPNLEKNTIGAVFNRAGYSTMRTCKQGNSYPAANKQFSVVHDATKRGDTAESGSAWHGERVLGFLKDREGKKDERPFFIYFGLSHPHDVRDATPELLAKYGATNHKDRHSPPPASLLQPPLPPNWLPAHPFDNTHMNVRDEQQVSGVWDRRDPATIRNEIGRDYACSENIDIQIARVLARLKEMGELDNTYIFYTADHGMSIGRHGLQGKQNLYEHTWRVPMIVKGPGIKPGSRVPGNIYLGDLLATFCDLAMVPVPETNQGTSFKPVLMGEKETTRDILYGVYNGGTKPGMRSVRKGSWKLIEYESTNPESRETQLFNLTENPHEFIAGHHDPKVAAITGSKPEARQTDLATDSAHADNLKEMQALLLEQMRLHSDPYRFSNQPDDGLATPAANNTPQEKRKKS